MPVNLDHVGLNTLIQEPVTASTNTIGYNLGEATSSYINTKVATISSNDYLVSLNIHRNGPYGWPIFKQTRIGENPLTRYQKRNSIFTYVTEIGDVRVITKDGKILETTRDRRSEIRSFVETPVVSGYKPLLLVGSTENESDNETDADERVEVEVSFANETTYFTNDLANKEHGVDDELDEAYEDFIDLYLDGGLDSDDSPFDEFELLKFSQTIYPRPENTFSENIRNRPNFVSGYWKDSAIDRTQTGSIDNGFGFTVPSQSVWPLDVESNWKTRALGATIGAFTASAGVEWFWGGLHFYADPLGSSGLVFSSGSNKIISNFASGSATGIDSTFVRTGSVYEIYAEKGSLSSVEGTRRFWNVIESSMKEIGLRYSGSNTYFHNPTDATFVTGAAYKPPRNNDFEYFLPISMSSADVTKFRALFTGAFTLSFRQLGAFNFDANGAQYTSQGTYLRLLNPSSTPDKDVFRFKRNSGTEFQLNAAVNYNSTDWSGISTTSQSTTNPLDGGQQFTYTIDNENSAFRGWSTITLEMPGTGSSTSARPALFVNAVSQSSVVTSSRGSSATVAYRYDSYDQGPNYTAGSGNKTGSYGVKVNPNTTFDTIFPAPYDAGSAIISGSSGSVEQFAIVLTLNLGAKPTNREGRGFSIFACSSSHDPASGSYSLVSFTTASSEYHSTLGFVLQSGSGLQTDATKFDKILYNIPISRANKATKFYLYANLTDKSKCFGIYHDDNGATGSMNIRTLGTLAQPVDGAMGLTSYLSKDSRFFNNPEFFDTDFTLCDIATLTGSATILTSSVTANHYIHSGSVLDFTSSYGSTGYDLVTNWYSFASKDSTFRPGITVTGLPNGTDIGYVITSSAMVANRGPQGTSDSNFTLHTHNNPLGSISIGTGLPTAFSKFLNYGLTGAGYATVLADDESNSNFVSDGDNRIANFALIQGINRDATLFYAQTGSGLYQYIDMTGSDLASAYPSATASIYYTFHSGAPASLSITVKASGSAPFSWLAGEYLEITSSGVGNRITFTSASGGSTDTSFSSNVANINIYGSASTDVGSLIKTLLTNQYSSEYIVSGSGAEITLRSISVGSEFNFTTASNTGGDFTIVNRTASGNAHIEHNFGRLSAFIPNQAPPLAASRFHISESYVGSIQPDNTGVGQLEQEGMLFSGSKQPFSYLVSNLSQEGIAEARSASPKILGKTTASALSASENDLFVGGSNSFNTQGGGGILVNSYNTFNRFEFQTASTIDSQYSASCLYTRRHSLITASSFYNPFGMSFSASSDSSAFLRQNLSIYELYQGMAFWDAPAQSGRKPFFNDYNTFAESPRLVGKDFSIIPEFKISDHINKYLVSGDTSFNDSDNPLFNIEGGIEGVSNSDNDLFYKTYSTTEFLKNFDIIQGDHEGFVDPLSITLRCKAIKKLLPYKGFYPADRTVEIAQQFYSSYGGNLSFTSEETLETDPQYAAQNLLTPLFSPGILFNSIKSGVACDYPLVTSRLRTLSLSSSAYGTTGSHFINQQFDTRIPFEALVEPEKHLANLELISNEPDEKAAPNTTVVWNGQGDEKYRLMASNFLAEVGDFYLQNKNYSTIASLPQGDPNFGNAKAGLEYRMRLRMYRSISGSKDVYGDIKPRNAIAMTGSTVQSGLHTLAGTYDIGNMQSMGTGLQNSVSFWFNINDNDTSEQTVLAFEDKDTNKKITVAFNTSGASKTIQLKFFSNSYTNQRYWQWTTLTFSFGEWHHAVIVFNSAHMDQVPKLYLDGGTGADGTSYSTSGTGAGSVATINTLSIGATKYGVTNTGVIAGSVQDVAVWSAGLTATDVSNVYNGGSWKNLITHVSASSLISWHLLGEEPNMPTSGSNLPGDGSNFFIKTQVGGSKQTLYGETNITSSFVRDGVGSFGTTTTGFTSPIPEGTFGLPQDTGSMSESITMYSKPSGFGPPQKLLLSGSSKYKLKFNAWESFKKGNNISDYYHTTDSLILSSSIASPDSTFKDLEFDNGNSAFIKGNDAQQGYNYPFTPPYYHGEAWADITFKPEITKKYTLSEIINSSSVEFLRYYKPYRTSSAGETINWRLVNEDAMQLASSINIFSRGILPGTNTTDLDIANSYRWIMQSKFETPILDFSHQSFTEDQQGVNYTASVSIPNIAPETTPIGMWHQYGKIPQDPKKGVFIQVTDVPRGWIENATKGKFNATASLADLCGFSTDPVKMGEISSIKEVSEAIVAVPYLEIQGSRQFFKISKRDIKHALDPKLRHLVGETLIDMVNRMKKFVLPPSMDFVANKQIQPFAMYIFEFTHTFTREDLSNIWQNLQPDISISHEIDEVEISHELLFHELLGGKAKLKPSPTSNNEEGAVLDRQARLSGINPDLRWMVFKAKQRAKNNYFEKIFARNESNPNQSGDTVTNTSIGKKLNVGFNWPYDFFSLIELGKMEADIILANADDENQEEKLVIKPRIKASKALPKIKESDEIINNSLFGTGEDQPGDVTTTSDRAKIKPNPLGKLSRRRRKK